MFNLAGRVIRQVRGDKRTVAMILFAPLLILSLLYFLLGNSDYKPTIAVDQSIPARIVSELNKQDAIIVTIDSNTDKTEYLKDNKADAIFSLNGQKPSINMLEPNTKSQKALTAIKDTLTALNPAADMETNFVYGNSSDSSFNSLGYVFLGIFAFFLVFIISGMALVRERSGGTLERLLMSPIKRYEVVMGYTIGYSVYAILQAILVSLFAIFVLHLTCAGNPIWVVVSMLFVAITAVSFGATISIFAATEFQVVQLIPIAIIPQIFFSGLIPLDTIPYGLGNLCYFTPIYYGCSAIKRVMIEGSGFCSIWTFLAALAGYTFVLCVINSMALKKYRNI